jgi:hypothetical protein
LEQELEHARFRDADLSVKGAGLLAFAGLMLACDFVFLSAASEAFISPRGGWEIVGLAAALVLMLGAFCALYSMLKSDGKKGSVKGDAQDVAKAFLVSADGLKVERGRWLARSGVFTLAGTLAYVSAILASVADKLGVVTLTLLPRTV